MGPSWKGYSAHTYPFKHLSNSFRDSYLRSIAKHHDRPFLQCVSNSNEVVRKTFFDFDRDVRACLQQENLCHQDAEVIVTLSGNRYENLVFIVAGLLSGKVVCPLNGLDSVEYLASRLKLIDQPKLIYSSFETPLTQNKMVLQSNVEPLLQLPARDPIEPMIYVFTSGTTGDPKIVQQREIGILVNADSLIDLHQMHKGIHLATCLPVFHVNALEFSFVCSLLSGSQLTLFEKFDFFQFFDKIAEYKIDVISIIPSIIRTMLGFEKKLKDKLPDLKYVVTAASALSPQMAKQFCETFEFNLIQGYGLSEAVNFSAVIPPTLPKTQIQKWLCQFEVPSIGVPLDGNDMAILDDSNNRLNAGQEGEIAIQGLNLMKGYRSERPIATDMYFRTGDQGHFRICEESGKKYFFITGRKKDVIKRYGETVSLKEADDALLSVIPASLNSITVGFAHDVSGEEVGAVVYGPSFDEEDWPSLKTQLLKIDDRWRPKLVLIVDKWPYTESGKPKRWIFAQNFSNYRENVFGKDILLAKETITNA